MCQCARPSTKKRNKNTARKTILTLSITSSMPAAKKLKLKLVNSRCPGNTSLAPSHSVRVTFYYSSCLFTCLFIICVLLFFFFRFPPILFNCFGNKQYTGTLQTQKETTNLLDYQKEFHCMEKGWDVGATSPLVSIELQGGSLTRLRTEPYVVSFFISFCWTETQRASAQPYRILASKREISRNMRTQLASKQR